VTAGDGVTHTYTITVSNAGPSDATNVTVGEASFPVGFTMGTVSSSQGSCAAFPCNLGTIANGGSATISVDYTVRAPRSGSRPTPSRSRRRHQHRRHRRSDDTTVTASSDLTVTKTDGETSVTAGDGVTHTYTITVSNAGPSDATNVTVGEASFPVGFTMAPSAPARAAARPSRATSARSPTAAAPRSAVDYTVPSSTLGLQTNTVSVAVDGTNTGDTGASTTRP